jgi:hypothetical protein
MRLVELPPISVSITDEEILADLLYPAGSSPTVRRPA